jgi:hypothetical protein
MVLLVKTCDVNEITKFDKELCGDMLMQLCVMIVLILFGLICIMVILKIIKYLKNK